MFFSANLSCLYRFLCNSHSAECITENMALFSFQAVKQPNKLVILQLTLIVLKNSKKKVLFSLFLFQGKRKDLIKTVQSQNQRQERRCKQRFESSWPYWQSSLFYQLIKYQLGSNMGKKIINKQSPTCSGRWCQTHLFSIRPIYVTLSNPKEDSIRLCPKLNKDKKTYEKVLPKLNLDKKFYTPTFILQEDERLYIDHDKSNLRNFEQNKFSQEEQISDIMIPKVNSYTAFCRVCRQNYEDYLQHCNSVGHMSNVAKHPYSVFIVELVENFKTNGCKQTISQTPNSNSNFIKNNQICLDEDMQSQLQDKETCFRLKQNYNEKVDSRLEL